MEYNYRFAGDDIFEATVHMYIYIYTHVHALAIQSVNLQFNYVAPGGESVER